MTLSQRIEKNKMTKYQLADETNIPYSTLYDLCSGKTSLYKTSAHNICKLAKSLNTTVESLLEGDKHTIGITRSTFEVFKSNLQHALKNAGDLSFIETLLSYDYVEQYMKKKWNFEALYTLAMVDYLSRINNIPLFVGYEKYRSMKFSEIIYPSDVIVISYAEDTDRAKKESFEMSIPEFKRFNIVEINIRNVA
jgi:transcriptional regulator with XRE-family HTH domain